MVQYIRGQSGGRQEAAVGGQGKRSGKVTAEAQRSRLHTQTCRQQGGEEVADLENVWTEEKEAERAETLPW